MELHNLKPTEGSTHAKKRLGRGVGSGTGKTSGKGTKGQNSRSGGGTRLGFEGGQTPFFKRMPKRGFTNIFKKEFQIVNLEKIEALGLSAITAKDLFENGLIRSVLKPVKVLGDGKLSSKIDHLTHIISDDISNLRSDI